MTATTSRPVKGGTTARLKLTPKVNGQPATPEQRAGKTFEVYLILSERTSATSGGAAIHFGGDSSGCCRDVEGWHGVLETFDAEGTSTLTLSASETKHLASLKPGRTVYYSLQLKVTNTSGEVMAERYDQKIYIPFEKWEASMI